MDTNDLNNLPPMRTGFNLVDEDASVTLDRDVVLSLTSIMSVFMEGAVQHAVEYSKAAGRSFIAGEDVIRGLQFEALPTAGVNFWTRENLLQRAREWRARRELG